MTAPASWTSCLAISALSMVAGLWGTYLHACPGVFSAMLWTIFAATFGLVFLPAVLAAAALGLALGSLALRAASANARVAANFSLLAFVLPVLCIGIGYTGALAAGDRVNCTTIHT